MTEAAPSAAQSRRFPRLSIPGGLLLGLCLFLPVVKACDAPLYPIKLPAIYGPYLFGLLAVVLAFLPMGRTAIRVRFTAWAIGTLSAVGEGWFFLDSLLAHHQISPQRWLWLGPLLWLPLVLLLAGSVRHHRDSARWHAQLLFYGGSLSLLFFGFVLATENAMFGLWLAMLASILLLSEGAGTQILEHA